MRPILPNQLDGSVQASGRRTYRLLGNRQVQLHRDEAKLQRVTRCYQKWKQEEKGKEIAANLRQSFGLIGGSVGFHASCFKVAYFHQRHYFCYG